MKPTEADTTRNAILSAFWAKGRKEFVELTTEEIARRSGVDQKVICGTIPHMEVSQIPGSKSHALTAKGQQLAAEIMEQRASVRLARRPKLIRDHAPQEKPKTFKRIISDEAEYAKAMAALVASEAPARIASGIDGRQAYKGPKPPSLPMLQARVLAAVESGPQTFTATAIADQIGGNIQQVATAMRELRIGGHLSAKYCRKSAAYTLEASPAGREMPKSEISDPPQPKYKVRVVERQIAPAYSTAGNGQHVNKVSVVAEPFPLDAWAAE